MDELVKSDVFGIVILSVVILCSLLLWAIFSAKTNDIYCWQLISTRGRDGQHYADIDKLGKTVALIVLTCVIIYWTWVDKLDLLGLTLYLGYAGGVAAYSSTLRARGGNDNKEASHENPPNK